MKGMIQVHRNGKTSIENQHSQVKTDLSIIFLYFLWSWYICRNTWYFFLWNASSVLFGRVTSPFPHMFSMAIWNHCRSYYIKMYSPTVTNKLRAKLGQLSIKLGKEVVWCDYMPWQQLHYSIDGTLNINFLISN